MCCSCCNCCKKPEMVSGVITKSIPLNIAYSMPKVNLSDIGSGIDQYGTGFSDSASASPFSSGLGIGYDNGGISPFGGYDALSGISTKRCSGCCCCNN